MSGYSLKDVKTMSDKDLEEAHDEAIKSSSLYDTFKEAKYFLDELNWRKQEKQTKTIKNFTILITVMTVIMTISTIVNVVLFFLNQQ